METKPKTEGMFKVNAKLFGNRLLHFLPLVERSKQLSVLYAKKSEHYSGKNSEDCSAVKSWQTYLKLAADNIPTEGDTPVFVGIIKSYLRWFSGLKANDDMTYLKAVYESDYYGSQLTDTIGDNLKWRLKNELKFYRKEKVNAYYALEMFGLISDAIRLAHNKDPAAAFAAVRDNVEPKLNSNFDDNTLAYMLEHVRNAYESIASCEKGREIKIDEHSSRPATNSGLMRQIYERMGDIVLEKKICCNTANVLQFALPSYAKVEYWLRDTEYENFCAQKMGQVLNALESMEHKPTPKEYGDLLLWAQKNCGSQLGMISNRIFAEVEKARLSEYMGIKPN
ncbi:MAG: hypothetical protein NTV88_02395 [Candidatus Micrarchaeota archaeon]|nr:hypothetical protein [Candidatus Micrarchaeota archaeon]